MSVVLEARSLSAGYSGHAVVHDLALTVGAGEIVALLGPNGAGKTTTILTLAGDLPPIAGSVHIDGAQVRSPLHKRARRGMSLVTEERSVFMDLTTAENLRVGRCDIQEALDLFPVLRPLLPRRAGLLSGGEQQILTLARALARRPRLLLVDEVSLGLAPQVVTRLLAAIRTAATATGMGVLLVEQQVQRALDVADRGYVMRRGRLVLEGSAETVRRQLPAIAEAYLSAEAVAERGSRNSPAAGGSHD